MQVLKNAVKKTLRHYGVNISSIQSAPPLPLAYHRVDVLFDIGANVGQYATKTREDGYTSSIVSFEPLSSAHALLKTAAAGDSQWQVHERCAVGDAPGEAKINISGNSFSSSLLPMLAKHSDAAPESVYVSSETTKVITLDSVFRDYWQPGQNAFLKIDTQGYEKGVLDGAAESLEHVIGVQLELSVVPLYESQALYDYFFNFFSSRGFILWSVFPAFSDLSTGQLLQFDGIFVRPK